jgi:MSHA biogenesis protein MshQ
LSPTPSATWTAGQYSVNSAATTFTRAAAPDGAYDSLAIGVRVVDADGTVLSGRDMNAATSTNCVAAANCDAKQMGVTTSVRFGRLRLQNAYGSQLLSMLVPITAQYWNGSGFVTNTLDSCTSVVAANVAVGNPQPAGFVIGVPVLGGVFAAGVGSLRLPAPAAGTRGSVDVSVNLSGAGAGASCTAGMPASTAGNKSWLQSLWCTPPGTYASDPTARAIFGINRSADKFIYRQENR